MDNTKPLDLNVNDTKALEGVIINQISKDGDKYLLIYPNPKEAEQAKEMLKVPEYGVWHTKPKTDDVYHDHAYVNWHLGSSGNTSAGVKSATGITYYSLKETHYLIGGKYQLTFHCDKKNWLRFKDEEGDSYLKLVILGGTYSIAYSSNKPNIVRIDFNSTNL